MSPDGSASSHGNDPGSGRVPDSVPEMTESRTRADAGTEAAFNEYVIPEMEVMYRVAMSITRNHSDAEDLVQDTLLRAYKGIDRFDGGHARAWLLTIMRNAQINRVRRRRPGLLRDPDSEIEHAPVLSGNTPGPEDQVIERGFDWDVEAAYQELPEKFREVIDLVDLGQLSYVEAAEMIGVPKGTVMSRLHRGRKRIRETLKTTSGRDAP